MNNALLHESPTVATLNARGELRKLRMLVNPNDDSARAELDRIEELLIDTFTDDRSESGQDGWYSDTYVSEHYVTKDERDEIQEDLNKAEHEQEKLEEQVQEYRRAAEDSEDDVRQELTAALDKIAKHDKEVERLLAKLKIADDRVTDYAEQASDAATECNQLRARMASWLLDRTAVETADHYREKYEATAKEHREFYDKVRKAVNYTRAGRSKVRAQIVLEIEQAIFK